MLALRCAQMQVSVEFDMHGEGHERVVTDAATGPALSTSVSRHCMKTHSTRRLYGLQPWT